MSSASRFTKLSARVVHPLAWVWEPLQDSPSFVLRSMFGAKSVYLDGRIMLCCTAGAEPWNGILICTSREHHAALQADFPMLGEHPILGKWLYVSQSHPRFEAVALSLVRLVRSRDPRIGVLPAPRKLRRGAGAKSPQSSQGASREHDGHP